MWHPASPFRPFLPDGSVIGESSWPKGGCKAKKKPGLSDFGDPDPGLVNACGPTMRAFGWLFELLRRVGEIALLAACWGDFQAATEMLQAERQVFEVGLGRAEVDLEATGDLVERQGLTLQNRDQVFAKHVGWLFR